MVTKLLLQIAFKRVRMRKFYCTMCKKCKEIKKPKISYICDKTLLLSSICHKSGSELKY